ncbi:sigma 54-interacting transcriptional regulator [Fusibacter paucivorans]|uniref:Sigma 54-interacting transcriptional regulator n=1 Tax=Fusibacter paucivorans TaxID=76009 RepID=A0ABS5PMI1_9FIRM|nr:sigma-54-dependent Fis family transcriptional regulator [Fusibacter paucivorans]MBS7526363.1 sigma 54-interacting transcriptional regulator [Fusibacter paucivorans]
MARIGMILPYPALYKEAKEILKKVSDIDVQHGFLSGAIPVAKAMINNGAEVLISRGGTSDYLNKAFETIPIIDIEVNSYDIAEAIIRAQKHDPHIALIVFKTMLYEGRNLSDIFDCDIKTYYLEKEEDATMAIGAAINDGYRTLVGGRIVDNVACNFPVKTFMIRSEVDSIVAAVRQGQQILKAKDESLRNLNLIREVVQNTYIGIIAVNESNEVKIANIKAMALLKKEREQVIGTDVYQLLSMPSDCADGNFLAECNGEHLVINKKTQHIQAIDIGALFTIERSSEINEKERDLRKLYVKKGYKAKYSFNDIKGSSDAICEAVKISKRFAKADSTVLIIGETGTGKEMFAQSIHNDSNRKQGPFVAVNCAALTDSLLESELFGYVKGAFTGASSEGKEGLFEMAHGGTIFLDEISEVSLTTQAKLLRVLQEREIMRIGDNKIIPVDVRIIAATNRDLHVLIENGVFRNDLYYRLSVLKVSIPPVRKRIGDVELLIKEFLKYYTISLQREMPILDKQCFDVLRHHAWPGNIRELKNFVERLLIAFDETVIFPEMIYKTLDIETETVRFEKTVLTESSVKEAFEQYGNNKTRVAKALGIGRTTLWKWLKEHPDCLEERSKQ